MLHRVPECALAQRGFGLSPGACLAVLLTACETKPAGPGATDGGLRDGAARDENSSPTLDAPKDALPRSDLARPDGPRPCLNRREDCDRQTANGCETNIDIEVTNCGGCGLRCGDTPHGAITCEAGRCVAQCEAGWADCSGARGCPDDLSSDALHCGECGRRCSTVHAMATCRVGRCVMHCDEGYGDCDGDGASGCETDLQTHLRHCGACGRACAGLEYCAAGLCVLPPITGRRPLHTARTTSDRPTLRWDGPGARVQVCADRACERVEATIDTVGASARPALPLASGVHFWRVWRLREERLEGPPSAVWEFFSPPRDARFDTSWGGIPDLDGDGLSDVVAHFAATEGVFVWPSSLGGLRAAEPLRVLPPPSHTESFSPFIAWGFRDMGADLFALGDVDGDGYADVGALAPGASSHAGAGYVSRGNSFVLHGAEGGLVRRSDPLGWWFMGGVIPITAEHVEGPAGDVDGNGSGDRAVLNMTYDHGSFTVGDLRTLFGSGGLLPVPLFRRYPGFNAIVPLGDIDGDGASEVWWAHGYRGFGGVVGRSTLFWRRFDRPPADCAEYLLLTAARSLGDIDLDGLADFDELVECVNTRSEGALYRIEHRHDEGGRIVSRWVRQEEATLRGDALRDDPGWIGDATGDGIDDLVRADPLSRVLALYAGTPSGPSSLPSVTRAYPEGASGAAVIARAF